MKSVLSFLRDAIATESRFMSTDHRGMNRLVAVQLAVLGTRREATAPVVASGTFNRAKR